MTLEMAELGTGALLFKCVLNAGRSDLGNSIISKSNTIEDG
jgi:hypothetical protein